MKTERDIIACVLAGETRQYALLVDRYKDRAFTFASHLLVNREEAEETVQDAFVRAFRSLADFRHDAQFGTWFYRILYNACMTRVSRRRPGMVPLDDLESGAMDSVVGQEVLSALDEVAAGERVDVMYAEMEKLPEQFRAVLVMFYVQEQRYEEMATILDVPVGTVKTHLFRARALLRKRMMKRFAEEMRAA
jgi:RNA polymerase sigma-70 factor (ECF subfamily)